MDNLDGTPSTQLPNVKGNEIISPAFMVWQLIHSTGEFKHARTKLMDGQPGREWRGSVNHVVDTIWPSLTDRYIIDREGASLIKKALNRYLRGSGNLKCVDNGGVKRTSTWWVSERWAAVETRNLNEVPDPVSDAAATAELQAEEPEVDASDVFDVPVPEPTPGIATGFQEPVSAPHEEAEEEMNEELEPDEGGENEGNEVDGKLELYCRFEGECTHGPIDSHQGRASHERWHGIRVNRDGTVSRFDPKRYGRKPTNGEVSRVLVDVAKMQVTGDEGLTMGDLLEHAMAMDPTITKEAYRKGVDRLLATPFNGHRLIRTLTRVETSKSATTKRYSVERITPTPKEAVAAVPTQRPTTGPVAGLVDTVTEQKMPAGGTEIDIKEQVNNLLLVAQYLDQLGAQDAKIKELEAGLKASSSKNFELVERLKVVTAERDALKGKLDTLKSVFS